MKTQGVILTTQSPMYTDRFISNGFQQAKDRPLIQLGKKRPGGDTCSEV